MRFHVRVEYGFVDARIAALGTLEWFGIDVIARVILEVMLVLGHERAMRAGQQFLGLDVSPGVLPKVEFRHGHKSALRVLALVRFQFALRRHARHSSVAHFSIVHS